MKSVLHHISFTFFKVITYLARRVPHNTIESFIYFMLTLTGYRRKVILKNLKLVYPGKKNRELIELLKANYRHLARLLSEIIADANIHVEYRNVHLINEQHGTDGVILLCGHIHNWELTGRKLGPNLDMPGYGVYKPLSNRLFDSYLQKQRTGDNAIPIPMNKLLKTIIKHRRSGKPAAYLLIADQSPPNKSSQVQFMGVPTYFIDGPEKLNERFDFQYYYMHTERAKEGHYIVTFLPIDKAEITVSYSRLLEANIRQDVPSWLWSHNRWKLNYRD